MSEESWSLKAKWMIIPNIDYGIASHYNVVFVHLSRLQNWTSFSLKSLAPTVSHIIAIEFVNENHFVHVYIIHYRYHLLLDNCHLPAIVQQWRIYCTFEAHSWQMPYMKLI
ncbi:hypothetical protein HKD37_01G002857 [Glycine soja]